MELNQANSNRISYFGINFSILYEKLRLHFTGSGLAALMTVYKMIQSGAFQNKSILLIDQDPKKPMITWCFWQDGPSTWQQSVTKQWDLALFANSDFHQVRIKTYTHNRIKASDFTAKHLI
jgi:lycopene beta-cyclase